jgi:fatty acid/phospholipid biosynthesis enzyme
MTDARPHTHAGRILHGSSDANAIKNAIRVAKEAIEGNVVELIRSGVQEN